ncbi:hypothetical protein [Wenzhouxiangella sp. XN24]|uniref:tetratricopeptide repeat protein n=1 Tax=Wenzhouxiangella sp. XN24 TaxID=2713569 RepID=UPI0013EA559B|nr:hypothetical protein [Wenzhouxiangella sp. XN24]NGX15843.1 hypothetical protein [Wenzhouxiangella sp. XN24]
MSFFDELKRRKVIRVAAAYLVVGWVIIEVASTVAPNLNLPEWTARMVTLLVILGFPLALILAWIFEVTPEGMHVTEGRTGSKRFYVIVALVTAAALAWTLWPASGPEPMPAQSSTLATTPPATAEPPTSVSAVDSADKNTIAVLPFVNMSANPENVFFAEGIAEELLNILAGVDGLKVASRTSAFSFRGKDTPIPEIARELDVRHILEGSVRRQGDRVRITAQLIETESDTHLWSETFERDLVDIFRVQEEIAQSITGALKDVLGVQTVSVAAATADLEAYERFLRGRSRFYQRVDLDEAISDLRFAVERDRGFAEAWAFLGAASFVVGNGGYPTQMDRDALMAHALEASERALELDPELSTALAVKGQLLSGSASAESIAEGLRLLERAAARVSADTSARLWLGLVWIQLGFVERALPHLESAQDQDPLVAINNGWLGLAYAIQGRWEEGSRLSHRAVELSPLSFWTYNIAIGLVHAGREEEAKRLLSAAQPMMAPGSLLDGEKLDEILAALEDPGRRADFLAANRFDPQRDNAVGAMYAALMFRDEDEVFRVGDTRGTLTILRASAWLPSMAWLREDPRFYEIMHNNAVAAYWEAEGYPPGCRAIDDPAGRRLDCSGYGP